MATHLPTTCPCCSGKSYANCCEPFHRGQLPNTALELMRSRFSAYALDLPAYIMATTHPTSPTYSTNPKKWEQEIHLFSKGTQFQKLEILDFQDGTEAATVTFIAHLKQGSKDSTFTEKSQFLKVNQQWLYTLGKVVPGSLYPSQARQLGLF